MMKIAIYRMLPDGVTPDLNSPVWIAGTPVSTNAQHSAVADEARAISRKVNKFTGAGWNYVTRSDGGNEEISLSFRTVRTFSSGVAAWRWRNAWSKAVLADWPHPLFGDVVLRFESPDGTYEEVILREAYVPKPTMRLDGVSLELSYTIQAGELEESVSGLVNAIPTAAAGASIQMKLYGTPDGADSITDAATVTGAVASLPVGTVISIQGIDNISSDVVTKDFEIVSGGSPAPGNIAVTHPIEDNLQDIVDEYAAETLMEASLVDDGVRPYVLLSWLATPADEAEVRLTVTLNAVGYEANTTAADFDEVVIPVDANGDIPVAGDDS